MYLEINGITKKEFEMFELVWMYEYVNIPYTKKENKCL
jgi:hypothetical protein